jgi:AraC-like DNA-binding protein
MKPFIKYFTPDISHLQWGITIITCGHAIYNPDEQYPFNNAHPSDYRFEWNRGRILNGYYLVYITRGCGYFECTDVPLQKIEAGQLIWLYPGVWHRYKPDNKTGWEEYWIGFKGFYADQLMNSSFFNSKAPIQTLGHDEKIMKTFLDVFDHIQNADVGYQFILSGVLLKLLGICYLQKNQTAYTNDFGVKIVEKAKFILQENAEKSIQIEEVAAQLNMGYACFRKVFKSITGIPPAKYHRQLRIERAKEFLKETSMSIKAIASQLDFVNVYHFSNLFKDQTGVSPLHYRHQQTN